MSWLVWLIIFIILVIVEMTTPTVFFSLCLAFGALAAGVISFFHVQIWVEVTVFTVASIAAIYIIRPMLKKWMSKMDSTKSNVDALIGAAAIVTQDIVPNKAGFIEAPGGIWLADAASEIKAGEKVIIESISGTKAFVKKYS
ncbi:MAG: NfeD family protein [Endomicrobium sp.]|jgi:membrane protein implicated in regulation of membrane protease activity|nr:NfeD family protein [Endomicrobium sp.]